MPTHTKMVTSRSLPALALRIGHNLLKTQTNPGLLHIRITNNSHATKLCRNFHASFTVFKHVFTVQDAADFEQNVMKSDKPVIVDFYANWCGPCKILGPRLEKIIGSRGGDVTMAKVDIDNPDLDDVVSRYKVASVPTIIAVVNGKVTDQFVGAKDEDQIEAFLDKAAGK